MGKTKQQFLYTWSRNEIENITISNFNISAASKNKADIKLTNGKNLSF